MSQVKQRSKNSTRESQVQTILGVRTCDSGIQGPENLILALAERLAEQHVKYVTVNLWDGDPPTVALHDELIRRGFESHVIKSSSGMSPWIIPRLTTEIRKLQPDLVHTHDVKAELAGWIAARWNHCPLVGAFYGRLAMSSLFLKLADLGRFGLFRFFDRVLANSTAQRDELLKYHVPEKLIEMFPSFVDGRALKPPTPSERAEARRELQIDDSQPVLATIAKLSLNKGHTYMLQALPAVCEQHPDLLYLIPGEGDVHWRGEGGLRGELEREAESLGVANNVRFLGYYPNLATILHATDMVVSPSLLEGMQVALLEAMAAGRPIVATNIGGTPDAVVDNETGLLVEPENPQALGHAVKTLFADPVHMRSMGDAGRQRLERLFDAEVLANQLIRISEEVVSRRTP